LRSSPAVETGSTGAAQDGQNLAPGGSSAPQAPQVEANGAPQLGQNLASLAASAPQLGHVLTRAV
jgi:hypothetical protein